jgi:hypothetical protein
MGLLGTGMSDVNAIDHAASAGAAAVGSGSPKKTDFAERPGESVSAFRPSSALATKFASSASMVWSRGCVGELCDLDPEVAADASGKVAKQLSPLFAGFG